MYFLIISAIFVGFFSLFVAKSFFSSNKSMADESWKNAQTVYDFTVKNIKGEDVPLSNYKGQVLIIVNVASKCGYTGKHYKELVELDDQLRDRGLRILAFPCNQFGGQEPGDADQICEFTKKRNVNFDLFEKVKVNGDDAAPLFKFLKHKQGGTLVDAIKWNFTKFIVDKNGIPVERHAANASPASLVPNIEKYL
uniref:Glutathione peroxidase n=1 Tax=Cacopsylla melanoneura TaxID=428564 RepID=A0A8D8ZKY8_9HEMI